MKQMAGIGAGILGVGVLFGGIFWIQKSSTDLASARLELAQMQEEHAKTEAEIEARLEEKTSQSIALEGQLRLLEEEHSDSKRTVRKLSEEVQDLEKIVETDPELLAKYSKVYFLNENYAPSTLAPVPSLFVFQKDRTYEVHAQMEPFLTDLLEESAKDGMALLVASAYRSFATQTALKSSYTVRYGSGANAFSAEQGYSEHQLGTTVDLTTPSVGGTFAGFDKTDEYEWLTDNAWRYGFILSYPRGNSYYQYEPWHWRFVGTELAERLHEEKETFYDLDQRTLDKYLGVLFD